MRIIFIAKHDNGGNDEEGSVTYALSRLGHDVQRLSEAKGSRWRALMPADAVLFFKWDGAEHLAKMMGSTCRVGWYFDRVETGGEEFRGRDATRRAWMDRTLPHVDLLFCTDGDWVAKVKNRNVRVLRQAADERVIGRGEAQKCEHCFQPIDNIDVLFCGGVRGCGKERQSFIEELQARHGKRFRHVPHGVHGRVLADLVASAKVVVAPDFPVSDRYWSNRVYLMLGFGAFLLHPFCQQLTEEYAAGHDLLYYQDRPHLYDLIAEKLLDDEKRRRLGASGLARTLQRHTYTERCKQLVLQIEQWRKERGL